MVMKFFRKHFSAIIWFVVIIFIVGFVILSGVSYMETKKDSAFKIGGTNYTLTEYLERVQKTMDYIRQEGKELDEKKVKQDVLDSFISEAVMLKFANELKVRIDEKDIQNAVEEHPYFQENGVFSYDKYVEVLKRNNISPEMYESQLRMQLLFKELNGLILNSSLISPLYLNDSSRFPMMIYDFEWARSAIDGLMDKVPVSNEEINDYYAKHMEDFFVKPLIRIAYKEIPVETTKEDVNRISRQLTDMASEINAGKYSFEDAAKIYSEASNASSGGDLGWFDRDTLKKEITKAAFALSEGKISAPFQFDEGIAIVKTEERKTEAGKEKVKARYILMKVKVSEEMKDNIGNKALEIYSRLVKGEKLSDIFTDVKTTKLIGEDELPYVQMKDLFDYGKDETAGYPFFVQSGGDDPNTGKYIVFQLIEKKDGFYKKVENVAPIVKKNIFKEKIKEYAEKNSSTLSFEMKFAKATFDGGDEIIKAIFGEPKKETPAYDTAVILTDKIKEALDSMVKGDFSAIEHDSDIYLLKLNRKNLLPLSSEFNPDANALFEKMYSYTMFAEFLQYLKERYKVKVFRDRLGLDE